MFPHYAILLWVCSIRLCAPASTTASQNDAGRAHTLYHVSYRPVIVTWPRDDRDRDMLPLSYVVPLPIVLSEPVIFRGVTTTDWIGWTLFFYKSS